MPATSKPEQTPGSLLILAGRLVDGVREISEKDRAVLVAEGRIKAVGPSEFVKAQASPGTEVIDLSSACLTPGLIDTHTHLSLAGDGRAYPEMFSETDEMMVLIGAMNLKRHLHAGITTLREHGARNRVGFVLKEALSRGYISGPRMLVSGRPITWAGGHFHMCNEIADGQEEVRNSVRGLVKEGADYIKIMASGGGTVGTTPGRASYTTRELRAAVLEARRFNRLTAAHCRAGEAMARALEAGIDLLEHAEFLRPDNQPRFDPQLTERIVKSGTWVSPTLQAAIHYPRILELEGKRAAGSLSSGEEEEMGRLEMRAEQRLDLFRRMLEHGVRGHVVPGTDSGVGTLRFGHLDYELQLLVRAGFTPAEAFLSATRRSAEAIALSDEIGTVEPGKIADLVAFDGDPTRDISACSRVKAVFQAGKRIR